GVSARALLSYGLSRRVLSDPRVRVGALLTAGRQQARRRLHVRRTSASWQRWLDRLMRSMRAGPVVRAGPLRWVGQTPLVPGDLVELTGLVVAMVSVLSIALAPALVSAALSRRCPMLVSAKRLFDSLSVTLSLPSL